jgi:hypothetical protein
VEDSLNNKRLFTTRRSIFMSHKAKISGPEKIATIEKYLRGEDSIYHLANLLNVQKSTVRQWLQIYLSLGPDSLLTWGAADATIK